MLRTNRLKQKLRDGQHAYGLFASLPSPVAIELIAEAGFDFVIIDCEHVLINPETVENMIRTAESYNITPLVRAADADAKTLLRLLDGGAQGIVLPMVEQPEALAAAIAACKYHPLGQRSLNAGRPGSFGKHSLADYVQFANEQIMVVAMIESAAGVQHATEIAAVPGLDMILEGAADLSQSLGLPWQTGHAQVQQGLLQCWQATHQAGVPYCAIPRQPDDHRQWRQCGVNTFVLGDERGIAFRALQARLATTTSEGNE
ncbi:2-keto-3-deoxy-L-rhamnonate aldolase (plasmid) [Sodalis glossinidius str. 'morsitans']|uniref:2-keto-3-deoxy-L-rhamnonate aldolase n=1 Tax=Sodalis glossinidius (strain morsitans) TaxID=343509 RepID=Q2NQ28_SODGM|nr:aldolase/citrate lyase family protein [Sodalis glossinidius]BAE75747.1 achromobactin biosynthetic and transport gene acsB [Sodalis glossinidius str. 'morsitans']CAI59312.1 AcsB protein [Sodalis glossinidius]CAI59485.1 AcsB protein [Sodalis glossinidius]CRL46866.1 2-keto-3-deoxy-L-rhamnonate aldolase [Sodalis glossinidius str. 'morsitans']